MDNITPFPVSELAKERLESRLGVVVPQEQITQKLPLKPDVWGVLADFICGYFRPRKPSKEKNTLCRAAFGGRRSTDFGMRNTNDVKGLTPRP